MSDRTKFDFNLFRAMEVFLAVVETRQVTQAATVLGMTQSAASQHIKNLETAFETRLLDRTSRPIQLTKAGVSLYRRALIITNEIDDLTADVRRLESTPMPVLRIGMLASIATTLMADLVAIARGRFSIPEVVAYAGLANDHLNLLRTRQADLTITSDAFYDVDGLERIPVLRENFLLVTPACHDGPVTDLMALSQTLPLVRFTANAPVGRQTDQHLRRLRLEIPRLIDADRSSMVTACVAAGQGFAILTPTLLIDGMTEGMALKVQKLPAPGFSRTIHAVFRSGELDTLPQVLSARFGDVLRTAIVRTLGQTGEDAILDITE